MSVSRQDIMDEVADNMRHFSRVAGKPVFFSYNHLWDIHNKSQKFKRSMTRSRGFPSRSVFANFASSHLHIHAKKITVKIDSTRSRTSSNLTTTTLYAYIFPGQDINKAVHFGGVE